MSERPDLRLGDWREVLADVREVDALISDPPYSERTHAGHDEGSSRSCVDTVCERDRLWAARGGTRRKITYSAWTERDVETFVASWAPRVRGWFVAVTDHVLVPVWAANLEEAGRYVFAPLPLVETGSRVRLTGDGPSSWTCWIIVSRPTTREFQRWGTLAGAYVSVSERKPVIGGKPLGLMRAIIRDYTRPGDLVVDPCAGGGTTLLAAALEGRRAIGAEIDPAHYEIARERLARGFTPPLFVEGAGRLAPEQVELTLAGESGEVIDRSEGEP